MKLKSTLLAAGMLLAAAPAFAQFTSGGGSSMGSNIDVTDYNRIGVSYNNTHFSPKGADSWSLNGVGIDYLHGFSLSQRLPIFLEVGGKLNFGFRSDELDIDDIEGGIYGYHIKKVESKSTFITLSVPVNVAYRFGVAEDFSIQPYLGLNFKLHCYGQGKTTSYDDDGDKDDDYSYKYNYFDKKDMEKASMGKAWNRFQMGWHIGVGFQYKMAYLGLSYGTDFIKPVKKVNSSDFSVSLGYCF